MNAPQASAEKTVPLKIYSPKEPYAATVVENTRLTAPDSPNDVRHIVIDFKGSRYRYVEGQSVGVLPPGTDDATGRPHKLRLYSIASPAQGDSGNGETLSVCVKRVVYTDEQGVERRGVCSNFLCDAKPGDTVPISGPAGVEILMPETPDANIIMVATGTGIAPFRAFLHRRYAGQETLSGETWMIFGTQTRKDYLYSDTLESYRGYAGYHLVTAFSREETTADGRKMYVQERVREHGPELLALLQQPNTYFYICGLKGMETGILEAFQQTAAAQGTNWDALHGQLKQEHRWRVEVY